VSRTVPLAHPHLTRQAPEVVALYGLSISPSLIRQRIREEFERNRYIDDVRVIDRLILKWQQEYQETMNCWKQEPHIMGMLLQSKERPKETFLEKFYKVRGMNVCLFGVRGTE
jgi:NADH dehydrogenase (ubiquinone) 1 alpha subcomplex subunit 6